MAVLVEPRVDQESVLLEWTAPARPFRKGGMALMGTPLVIVVLVGLILLVAMEWMLIIVLAALVFAYYAWTMVPPEMLKYQITSRGIKIEGKLYDWDSLHRWWMHEQWGTMILMVETPLSMVGRLALPLGSMSAERVEKVMNQMLLAERPEDTALDKASRWVSDKFPLDGAKS